MSKWIVEVALRRKEEENTRLFTLILGTAYLNEVTINGSKSATAHCSSFWNGWDGKPKVTLVR